MSTTGFVLDPRLAADTRPLGRLPLSELRLMDDSRYPWVILVPRRPGLCEVLDLEIPDQTVLWQEVHRIAAVLRDLTSCDKLNIATLGNLVPQLHIHVVARRREDPAWPGPVWGHSPAQPYPEAAADELILQLRRRLGAAAQ
ncbi:HIT domain-containing protein [Frateuria aurantia]